MKMEVRISCTTVRLWTVYLHHQGTYYIASRNNSHCAVYGLRDCPTVQGEGKECSFCCPVPIFWHSPTFFLVESLSFVLKPAIPSNLVS